MPSIGSTAAFVQGLSGVGKDITNIMQQNKELQLRAQLANQDFQMRRIEANRAGFDFEMDPRTGEVMMQPFDVNSPRYKAMQDLQMDRDRRQIEAASQLEEKAFRVRLENMSGRIQAIEDVFGQTVNQAPTGPTTQPFTGPSVIQRKQAQGSPISMVDEMRERLITDTILGDGAYERKKAFDLKLGEKVFDTEQDIRKEREKAKITEDSKIREEGRAKIADREKEARKLFIDIRKELELGEIKSEREVRTALAKKEGLNRIAKEAGIPASVIAQIAALAMGNAFTPEEQERVFNSILETVKTGKLDLTKEEDANPDDFGD